MHELSIVQNLVSLCEKNATKENAKGTGLGLYMSKQIIDQFNAEITAGNSDNGACFLIKLPHKGEIDE